VTENESEICLVKDEIFAAASIMLLAESLLTREKDWVDLNAESDTEMDSEVGLGRPTILAAVSVIKKLSDADLGRPMLPATTSVIAAIESDAVRVALSV
jgi:hypothetical protein